MGQVVEVGGGELPLEWFPLLCCRPSTFRESPAVVELREGQYSQTKFHRRLTHLAARFDDMTFVSDLAAGLAGRGDPSAVDKMLEVRSIAHESAREVREVVAGYRAADLDTELSGASRCSARPG
jgi:hypothetical protein